MQQADPGTASADERIVAALLEKGRLKEADLARARRLQEETGGSLLSLLARLGLVSERDHAETCAEVLDLPLLNLKQVPELAPEFPPDAPPLSPRFLRQFHVCPLGESQGRLDLWMADPYDSYAMEAVQLATGTPVRPWVGLRSEIDER
jgi:general secretion pathway protein E